MMVSLFKNCINATVKLRVCLGRHSCAMDANATNAVLGVNSAIVLASSMNDPSVALVAFNQRDIFVEIKLM